VLTASTRWLPRPVDGVQWSLSAELVSVLRACFCVIWRATLRRGRVLCSESWPCTVLAMAAHALPWPCTLCQRTRPQRVPCTFSVLLQFAAQGVHPFGCGLGCGRRLLWGFELLQAGSSAASSGWGRVITSAIISLPPRRSTVARPAAIAACTAATSPRTMIVT
jgi:hypothetical protein